MPRPAKGPRLYLYRRAGREPIWIIRDGPSQIGTGCARDDRRGADIALSRYLAEKYAPKSAGRETLVADVLMIYAREHAVHTPSVKLAGYHLKALSPFWGHRRLSDVNARVCRAYAEHRGQQVRASTVRRELETLNAAIRYCAREHGTPLALLSLPNRGVARERWLTRSEAARLLWAAWRAGNRHLARFILIGLYSGTRHSAIVRLQWFPNTTGGWFDMEGGVMHRRGVGQRETSKRQPTIRIQRRLLPHLRRWRRLDDNLRFVVSWKGRGIDKERTAWASAVAAAGLGSEVTPHVLRHTCATWMMQRRVPRWEAAGYIGMSERMLESVYGHHHPDHQLAAATAF